MVDDEMVAVYDRATSVPVGAAPRSQVDTEGVPHANACVLLRRPDGAVYVHRRADSRGLPGLHDCFAGRRVAAGEDPYDCACRALAEELGVVVELSPLGPPVWPPGDLHLAHCWTAIWDGPTVHQASEVADGFWMSERDLGQALDDGSLPFVPDGRWLFEHFDVRHGLVPRRLAVRNRPRSSFNEPASPQLAIQLLGIAVVDAISQPGASDHPTIQVSITAGGFHIQDDGPGLDVHALRWIRDGTGDGSHRGSRLAFVWPVATVFDVQSGATGQAFTLTKGDIVETTTAQRPGTRVDVVLDQQWLKGPPDWTDWRHRLLEQLQRHTPGPAVLVLHDETDGTTGTTTYSQPDFRNAR